MKLPVRSLISKMWYIYVEIMVHFVKRLTWASHVGTRPLQRFSCFRWVKIAGYHKCVKTCIKLEFVKQEELSILMFVRTNKPTSCFGLLLTGDSSAINMRQPHESTSCSSTIVIRWLCLIMSLDVDVYPAASQMSPKGKVKVWLPN